jgi:hypothetical protein
MLVNPNANTSSALTNESFQTAVADYYPLLDYNNSFSLQGQQMYGEMRYICTALLVTGTVADAGSDSYQYQCVFMGSF